MCFAVLHALGRRTRRLVPRHVRRHNVTPVSPVPVNYRRPDRTLCRAVDGVWRCAHGKTWARVALLSFVTLFFCVVYPSTERGHADSSVALLMRHTDNNKLARVPSGRQLPRVSMWRKTCSLSLSYLSNSVLTHCRWSRRELGISREGGVEHAHDRRTVTNECVLLCS